MKADENIIVCPQPIAASARYVGISNRTLTLPKRPAVLHPFDRHGAPARDFYAACVIYQGHSSQFAHHGIPPPMTQWLCR